MKGKRVATKRRVSFGGGRLELVGYDAHCEPVFVVLCHRRQWLGGHDKGRKQAVLTCVSYALDTLVLQERR